MLNRPASELELGGVEVSDGRVVATVADPLDLWEAEALALEEAAELMELEPVEVVSLLEVAEELETVVLAADEVELTVEVMVN